MPIKLRKMTPRTAQKLFGMKTFKPAVMVESVGGKFSRFRKGERVRVRRIIGRSYIIEREHWRHPLVPVCNICANVHRKCLKL